MRRDLLIAMCAAAAFHGIILFGFNKKEDEEVFFVQEVDLVEDKKEEPPKMEEEPEPDDAPAEDLPNIEQFADAIAEPPSGVVEAGAITQYVRPTPPRPPRPPGMNQIGVPTAVAGGGGSGKAELIFDASQLDSPVRARFQPMPVYPPELKRLGVSGMVVVTFIIDTKGRVREPQLVSATDPAMGKSVLDAVVKWKFDPPLKNGKPVQARYRQPVPFNLN